MPTSAGDAHGRALSSPKTTTKRLETALLTLRHLNLVKFASTTIWIAITLDDLQHPEWRVGRPCH